MKNIVLSLMVLLIAIGVTAPMVGGTFASFSDVETSPDNYIQTADLDLKVDGEDDWQVGTCFEIEEGERFTLYPCTVPIWNTGCGEATAHLHIKNVAGPDSLRQNVEMTVRYDSIQVSLACYDSDNNGRVTFDELECQQIELGVIPADGAIKEVQMELHAWGGASGQRLTFDIAFELFGNSFSDIETSQNNYFQLHCELGGTPGFWKGPGALNEYGETETEAKAQIASWFREIVWASLWFEDELASGTDDEVYDNMVGILGNTGAAEYEGAVNQFRLQYLATRLNTKTTPPRLAPGTLHNISSIPGTGEYFGYDIGTLQQIIDTIESKETDGLIFDPPPSRDDMLIMKDVCDALNNVTI